MICFGFRYSNSDFYLKECSFNSTVLLAILVSIKGEEELEVCYQSR